MNGQDAELVLRGGKIYTVDAARSWAHALAVRAGTIVAVGTDAQMGRWAQLHIARADCSRGRIVIGMRSGVIRSRSRSSLLRRSGPS